MEMASDFRDTLYVQTYRQEQKKHYSKRQYKKIIIYIKYLQQLNMYKNTASKRHEKAELFTQTYLQDKKILVQKK